MLNMINGVILKDLVVHKDTRGQLFEIMRKDEPHFLRFGQAYITVCNPGWVKGWHYHKKQSDTFFVLKGKSKIVLYDIRKNSPTRGKIGVYILSEAKPQILRIPKGVVHGFECVGKTESRIMNIPDYLYNYKKPDEYRIKLDSKEVPYKPWWHKKGW